MKDVSYKRGIEKKQIWKFDISFATQEPAYRQGERERKQVQRNRKDGL
jgi:hypothetical protein